MASQPTPAHPIQLASLPQPGTASSWGVGAGNAGDYAHQQPWAEPAAATQGPADATAVEDKDAASVTAIDEENDIIATAVGGVTTSFQDVAEEATSAVIAQTLSTAAQPAATETPAVVAAPDSHQLMPYVGQEDSAAAVEAAATSDHATPGDLAEVAAAASASLEPAVESAAASLTAAPFIDEALPAGVPTASATAQLHVDNLEVTASAAAPGPGSARTAAAGGDESTAQLPLTSTAVAPDELHDTVAVMEANSHAAADGPAVSDTTAAEGGGPSYLSASPGVASGDSESGNLAITSDLAAAELGMCPEAAQEAMVMPAAEAADSQQLGMGTTQTHIQTAHVTLHGSTDTLETSAKDSIEDEFFGSTAMDTEQVTAAEDLDAHMQTELADNCATSDAEGAELADYIATSDTELSESTCWPSSQSGAAVKGAADVDTADASMPMADGDLDRSGGLGISAEGGETWSSTSVVPSHGAFNLALSLGSHESTLPDMLSMLC